MAWHPTSHYLNQWWHSLLMHICVTRPHWVNCAEYRSDIKLIIFLNVFSHIRYDNYFLWNLYIIMQYNVQQHSLGEHVRPWTFFLTILTKQSLQNFAQGLTAILLWYVQHDGQEWNFSRRKVPLNRKWDRKIISGVGLRTTLDNMGCNFADAWRVFISTSIAWVWMWHKPVVVSTSSVSPLEGMCVTLASW